MTDLNSYHPKDRMTPSDFIKALKTDPDTAAFNTLMDVIAAHYDFTPVGFTNGDVVNAPEQNQGSCKVFSFARMHDLSKAETLACFGTYYRGDVLQNPNGDDHQNIRNFMKTGWAGVSFEGQALTPV